MTKTRFFAGAVCALFFVLPSSIHAHEYKIGALKIDHPWSRATPNGAKVAGGFMTITNTGTQSDRLIGGTADFSKIFEVHEMSMEGGVMKMRALEKGLEIKPGATVQLKPGGYHVMFIDLQKPLTEGQTVKGVLTFEKAGTIEVEYKIEARGATGGHDAHKVDAPKAGEHKH